MSDDLPANDASLRSFIDVAAESHFPIQNLPFGIFSTPGRPQRRAGVAIGGEILDLAVLETAGMLRAGLRPVFQGPDLNDFIALGPAVTRTVRLGISRLLRRDNPTLRSSPLRDRALVAAGDASLHLPVRVGGFTDFMLSKEHSTNCIDILGGTLQGELWRNWRHLPMGYNGRASSVVVGDTPVRRPSGQILEAQGLRFAPTRKLDFELEAAGVVGKPVPLDNPAPMSQAEDHIFGLVLLNDWSARDIQAWESQPLGPFLGKGFRTSISPWIVTLDALAPFRTRGPEQDPEPLPHLRQHGARNFRVHMQASIRPQNRDASVVCRSRLEDIYWSIAQQVSHHTSAGCNLDTGDLLGTGTVSSGGPGAQGCLYEATRDGQVAVELENGGKRVYLEDGDEVELTGWCQGDGYRVGFGTCTGRILPPVEYAS
jgi:fumarylacetoacetase